MTKRGDITETLRQMRDTVDQLYAEALARLREANVANRKLRVAMLAVYPMEANDDDRET